MNLDDVVYSSFRDELKKIAGMSRIGSIPVSPASAAAGKGRFFRGRSAVQGLLKNAASFGPKAMLTAAGAGYVGGKLIERKAKKSYQDFQAGRQMRQGS